MERCNYTVHHNSEIMLISKSYCSQMKLKVPQWIIIFVIHFQNITNSKLYPDNEK